MSRDKGDIKEDLMSADNKESDGKKKKRIIIAIVSALLIALLSVGFFIYRDQFMAITMRIQRLVGTVNLYNEGHEQELREKMRLGAGQTVETAGESLIMVSLDDTKLMTMEESSKADIKARGKKLEFDLIEGNLFFNVTEKLKKRESFDIHTSTMICGIRGTSAYVGRDSTSHETLMVTDGTVGVDATNPVTKESIHEDVHAGEMITIYLDDEAEGNKTISIVKKKFREEDLPSLALDAIRKSPELQKRIAKAAGFSVDRLVALADATSKAGISMYGSAADKLSADGIKDAIPIMGYNAQIMVRTANRAVDTAGEDLPLEIAIIKGLNGTMNAGIDAGYRGEPLGALVDSAADCMEACIKGARNAGLENENLISVSDSVTGALQSSVSEMAKANLSTSEIAQVVNAIGTVYTEAIAAGASDSGNGNSSDAGSDISSDRINNILNAVGNASEFVTTTVDSEMLKQSTGEETAEELLRKARATEPVAEEGQVKAGAPRQVQGRPDTTANSQDATINASAAATSVNTHTSASEGGQSAGTTEAAQSSVSSSTNGSGGSSSSGSGNSGGNSNSSNASSSSVVYGDMTIAGGITGGTVSTPLAAGSAPAQGDTVTLNIAPNIGHSFGSLTVNKVDDNGNVTGSVNTTEVTAGSQYTFVMPAEKIVVNATFAPNTYNVNLNLNGATVTSGNITQYTYGTAVALPTQVTKASDNFYDYSFTGWTDAPTGGNSVMGISATDINDKNFYPQFTQTVRTYALSFSPNSGNALTGGNNTTYTAGTMTSLPAGPTKNSTAEYDYVFAGWFTDASGGTQVTGLSATDYGDKLFYAHWNQTPRTYNVNLYSDATTLYSNMTYTYGTGCTLPATATRAADATYRYTFAGWYSSATGGSSAITSISSTETGDKDYYAHWTTEKVVTGVSLPATPNEVEKGSSITVTASVLPTDAADQTVTFESSAPTVAGITQNGLTATITGLSEGTSTITVRTQDGNKTATLLVTVKKTTFTPTLPSNISGGSISVSPTTYTVGDTVTITATPDAGKELGTLTVNELNNGTPGSAVTLTTVTAGTTYTFTAPEKPVAIDATFVVAASANHTLTIANNITHGSVAHGGVTSTYETGDPVYLRVYPEVGYKVKDLYYVASGSSSRVNISNNTFTMPNANVTVYATFEQEQYTITYDMNASNDPQAQIVGTYTTTYTYGTEVILPTNVQRTGYTFDGWYTRADGGLKNTKVKTTDTGNKTFYAHWTQAPVSYSITIGSLSHGTVTSDVSTAHRGDVVTLTITPDSNYVILGDVTAENADGVPITVTTTGTNTATFIMPESNVTVSAVFAEDSTAYHAVNINNYIYNGSVSSDKQRAVAGDTVTLTLTPDSNSVLNSVSVYDSADATVTITDVSSASLIQYQFTMPDDYVSVYASFSHLYGISQSFSVAGGTVEIKDSFGNDITGARGGDTIVLSIKPNTGYSFAGTSAISIRYTDNEGWPCSVTAAEVAGNVPDGNGEYRYTFRMPYYETSISVEFVSDSDVESAITLDATTEHGRIIFDKTTAKAGEIVSMRAVPEQGYALSNIIVKDSSGGNIQVSDQNTFGMPVGEVTVKGIFVPLYSITTQFDNRKIRGVDLSDQATRAELDDNMAKAGDVVLVSVKVSGAPNVSFDGIRITDASGAAVTTQFIKRTEVPSSSPLEGPSVNYDYSFTMPASAVTVNADATTRRINISDVLVYYYDGNDEVLDTNGTYGTATLNRLSGEPGDTLTLSVSPSSGYYCDCWYLFDDDDDTNYAYGVVTSDVEGINLNPTYGYAQTLYVYFCNVPVTKNDVFVSSTYSDCVWTDKDEAGAGETVIVSIQSPEGMYCEGIELYDDGDDLIATVPADNIINGTVSFNMPEYDVYIEPVFEEMKAITRNYNRRAGSISINGDSTSDTVYAITGDTVTVSVSPNSGYTAGELSFTYTEMGQTGINNKTGEPTYGEVLVTRQIVLSNGVGTFTMPSSDAVIEATFESTSTTTYQINIDDSISNGTVTSDAVSDESLPGRIVTLTALPANGYRLVSLEVKDSSDLEVDAVVESTQAGTIHKFYMPDDDVTVTATFGRVYSISYVKNNIYINGNYPMDAPVGKTISLSINDPSSYSVVTNPQKYARLDSLEYRYNDNGVTVSRTITKGADGNYTFTMPESDVTVTAHTTDVHSVGVSVASGRGTWTATPNMAEMYGDIVYTITPAAGYVLDKIGYGIMYTEPLTGAEKTGYTRTESNVIPERNPDGTYTYTYHVYRESSNSGGFYGTNSVSHIWLYFGTEPNTISVDSNITGGTITPDKTTARSGNTVTFTAAPETGYELVSLSVTDASSNRIGIQRPDSTSYIFTMPASNVTISAVFAETSDVDVAAGDDPSTWFSNKNIVRINSDVDTNEDITVGDGQTLIISSGVRVTARGSVTVESGGVINNFGTFNTINTMTINDGGTFNNYGGHTLNNYGTIVNNGLLVNGDGGEYDGRINNHDDAVIENNGTIINNEGSVINNDGEIEGNEIEGDGELNGVEDTGSDSSDGPDPDEDGMPQSDPALLTEPASESAGSSPDDGQNDEESSEEEGESEEESSEEDE